jgi:drug/metabolite transporter (DMT)-like permease
MKNGKVAGMLIGFVLVTGATFNLAKYAVQYFSAASAAGWRFGIAALVMFAILISRRNLKWETIKRYGVTYSFLGIIGVFGFNTFFFLGMNQTSPINGALIMGTNPLITTILAYFILKVSISRKQTFGILFALLGVTLVLTKGSWEVIETLSYSRGDLLILAGNVCWALYGVLGRKYLSRSSSLETTTYTMIIGAIGLIALSAFSPSVKPAVTIPVTAWGAILFMAIFTSVLGYLWWNKSMEIIGAANTAVFFNLVPVVTMLISIMTGTAVTIVQVLGTLLVILGVLLSSGFLNFGKVYKVLTRSLE